MVDEGLKLLCAGIVEQAIKDYMFCLKYPRNHRDGTSIEGMEAYFHSPQYRLICGLDGDKVMELCRKEYKNYGRRKAVRRKGKKVPEGTGVLFR